MGAVSLELVKKLEKGKQPLPGLNLSSLTGDASGLRCVVFGEGLDDVKKLASSMRSEGYGLLHKSRGKSLEITARQGVLCGAFGAMTAFLSRLSFTSDEVTDMISFCCEKHELKSAVLSFEAFECDRESMSLLVSAELSEGADAPALYAELAPGLDRFGLGIIKEA